MALTAPGQTAGLSVFIDPLIRDLHTSRTAISGVYLVATLLGAATLTPVGRALDRYGIRRVATVIVVLFAATLVGFSFVNTLAVAAFAFIALRSLGQGGLTLSASQAVTVTFTRRRGGALGVASAVGNAGVALSPVILNAAIVHAGWRTTALIEAAVVAAVLLPIAARGLRGVDHRPHVTTHVRNADADIARTLRQTLRTPMFWAMAAALSSTAMLATGLSFNQIDLLGEHGLTSAQAAANFLPQTAATLLVSLATGHLLDRLPGRAVMATSMAALAVALILATIVSPGWLALAYAVMLGTANGGLRAQEATLLPRYYGMTHLGAIRGAITTISIAASAFGPLVLAAGHSAFGTYTPLLLVLVVVPVGAGIALLIAPDPRRHRPAR